MSPSDLEAQILKHIRAKNYKPVKPRVLTKQLGLDDMQRGDVRKAIKRLVKRGALSYGRNHVVRAGQDGANGPSGPNEADRVGTFQRTASGYGFVRPKRLLDETPGPDIYIPASQTRDASTGDLVRVRVRGRKGTGPDARVRGQIVDILERDTHQFVGTYRPAGEMGYVTVDGRVFSTPIPVGDPSAKNVRVGDKVVIEMIRFPSPRHEGEAVVIEVLGPRGEPGVDTLGIIREFNLPDEFPEEVLDSARVQADQFDPAQPGDRIDLTDLTIVTIDPADARDFDDAISLQKLANGHWQLGVHIADVAHFVPSKSPLDQEARERGTSVYLPDKVIPMLPEIISNHLASLQPHEVRFAKSVLMEINAAGVPIHTEILRSAIRSDHRFNYEEVQDLLDRPKAWRKKLPADIYQLVRDMDELAMCLRGRRMENGSLELVLPEIKIDLGDDGKVVGAHVAENTESHQIIEEFMLAANEAVAQWLTDRGALFLRRIHAPPSPLKLRDLTQFARDLGIPCSDLRSRFEIKRVLEEVAGRPEEKAVNYAVLRSMQKAVYGPQPEGHYALNKTQYCHFTSPIRRYPDLTVHRLLDRLAAGKKPRGDMNKLTILGEHCSDREQRAEAAERELIKVKLLSYLNQRLGEQMDAVVTGVEEYGLFVQGVELPAEGLIHISALHDDYYQYDPVTHTLTGRQEGNSYRLGDVVRVEVYHVDLDRRQLDFRVVTPQQDAARLTRAKTPRPRKTRPAKSRARSGRLSATKKSTPKGAKPKTGKRRTGR